MSNGYQYTVIFQNNSSNAGNVCLYQQPPSNDNTMALAWLAKYAYPTTRVTFTWSIAYDFCWSQTGQLVPGVIASAAQVWPADLTTTNQVTLTFNQAFTFTNQRAGQQSGSLYVVCDNTIPPNMASVGIGMSGAPTFLVQAQPNMNYIFTPQPQYWISFGDFTAGEVLDVGGITNPAQINFPPNIYSMTATLNADNTWSIVPTQVFNASLAAALKTNANAKWTDLGA